MKEILRSLVVWFLGILACLLFWLLLLSAAGCEILKGKHHTTSDSITVKKQTVTGQDSTQSGSVKKEESQVHEETEWFKLTMQYLQAHPGGDTTINNYYPQPATVIYEGGKGKKDEQTKSTDSSFYINIMRFIAASNDSLSRRLDVMEKNKKSETKGLQLLPLALLLAGLYVLSDVYKGAKQKFLLRK